MEPNYVKLYQAGIDQLFRLDKLQLHVMLYLLKHVNQQLQIVIDGPLRQQICDDLGCSSTLVVNRIIQVLAQHKMLFCLRRQVYQINPYIFGSMNWENTVAAQQPYVLNNGVAEKRRAVVYLTADQQEYVQKLEPVYHLAKATLTSDRLVFGRMDEICEQLKYPPVPQWYKDYITALWEANQ